MDLVEWCGADGFDAAVRAIGATCVVVFGRINDPRFFNAAHQFVPNTLPIAIKDDEPALICADSQHAICTAGPACQRHARDCRIECPWPTIAASR